MIGVLDETLPGSLRVRCSGSARNWATSMLARGFGRIVNITSSVRSGLTGLVARLAKHPAHGFGQPEELGHTCAYLCSVHAGYINGQNLLMEGGSFPGVF